MANITKLEFAALDISGKNYLTWVLDVGIHLSAMNLENAIKKGNEATEQEKAKAMIFIRHHIHEGLKSEYLGSALWESLKERYDHQKSVILPKARYEWMHLQLQDFKTVNEYNSAMFKIVSQLRLCGDNITDEDMLEKTYTTFHASNMLLQQQYRERNFKKYSQLISCLLVAEQNNELLMKNHNSHPTGSQAFPEVNANTSFPEVNASYYGNNRGHGRGCGRGRGRGYIGGSRRNRGGPNKRTAPYHSKGNNNSGKYEKAKGTKRYKDDTCYMCGVKEHWSRTCRTPKHLVDLYQASIKEKEKEANFINTVDKIGQFETTHLDVADFLIEPSSAYDDNEKVQNELLDGNRK